MRKNKSSISGARTYAEIGEFWDSHSLADHWDETHEVEFEVRAQRCLARLWVAGRVINLSFSGEGCTSLRLSTPNILENGSVINGVAYFLRKISSR